MQHDFYSKYYLDYFKTICQDHTQHMQDLMCLYLPTDQSTETRRNSLFFYLSIFFPLNIVPNHISDTSVISHHCDEMDYHLST